MARARARRDGAAEPPGRRTGRGAVPLLVGVALAVFGGVAVAASALVAGCVTVDPFACASASACVRAGEQGRCEATGWCSFPDPACDSGWRYGTGAGDGLATGCVESGQPQVDGGRDATPDALADGPDDAAPDDGAPDDALPPTDTAVDTAPCSSGDLRCDGDNLEACDVGAWAVKTVCALGCKADEQPVRCYTFAPENAPTASLTAGTFDWVVEADTDATTGGANIPGGVGRTTMAQADGARNLVILAVKSLWVKPGVMLRFTGTAAVAIVASGSVLVEGTIDVSASGVTAGPGGWGGGASGDDGQAPASALAAQAGSSAAQYDDSGGGGACFGAVGGQGGPGGGAPSPPVCTTFGSSTLSPLFGGGGGGGGGGGTAAGAGGGGGGAIQLVAAVRIDVPGVVIAAGAGGGGGEYSLDFGPGGGGGAGGGILLEAPVVNVAGAVTANGGGGGGGAYYMEGVGGTGTAGLTNRNPAPGGQGGSPSDRTIGAGGAGGAATAAAASGNAGGGSGPNGGGGGGAVGRIAVYSRSGATPAGTCSPDPVALMIVPE